MATDPHNTLTTALSLHQAGRLDEAAAMYAEVLASHPDHPDALQLLGALEHQRRNHEQAVELIGRAVAIRPDAPHYLVNLAEAQRALGRRDEAEISLRRAVELGPAFSVAHANLALLLEDAGRDDEARAAHEAAVRADPCNVAALVKFARFAGRTGDLATTLQLSSQAMRLAPHDREVRATHGQALALDGWLGGAIALLRPALAEKPDAEIAAHLANALYEAGAHAEALATFRQAASLRSDNADVRQRMLFTTHYEPSLSPSEIAEEHSSWARTFADPVERLPPPPPRPPDRPLRVGYVSGDFRQHAVSRFVGPLLAAHDHETVDVYCYANNRPDAVTARFRALPVEWRDIMGKSDEHVARLIRDDDIDVLVDLSGHSSGNRLGVFARRPAPVAATYLGYADTTGMSAIDYRITDAICDPPGLTEHLHSERLARVKVGPFIAYEPPPDISLDRIAPGPLPADSNRHVRFGSFNRPGKVSSATIDMWSRVLLAVPDARLVMKGFGLHDEPTRRMWLGRFASAGVDPSRIELLQLTQGLDEHFRAIGSVDVALDPFPYNGTTTTCESLLMGVPVVTRAGETHLSRVGLSLLTAVGLSDLAATSADDFVHVAVGLANDLPRLRALRRDLRDTMLRSPLCDARRLARELESLYQNWIASLA